MGLALLMLGALLTRRRTWAVEVGRARIEPVRRWEIEVGPARMDPPRWAVEVGPAQIEP